MTAPPDSRDPPAVMLGDVAELTQALRLIATKRGAGEIGVVAGRAREMIIELARTIARLTDPPAARPSAEWYREKLSGDLLREAHKRIEAALPEDEPDCVPDWVCLLLIEYGRSLPPEPSELIGPVRDPPAGEDALLPCPFCGSAARMVQLTELPEDDPNWNGWYVECCNASCAATTNIHFGEADRVLREKWNRRVLESQAATIATLERHRETLGRAIADAAIKAGICNADVALDGPQLLMLCGDLADTIATLRRALAELVACKDLKERAELLATNPLRNTGKHLTVMDEYLRRQPLAWKAARAALADEEPKA